LPLKMLISYTNSTTSESANLYFSDVYFQYTYCQQNIWAWI